jgi:hypothetical protein
LFTSKPACNTDPTVPLTAGDQVLIVNQLNIAPSGEGFDFGAGMPQNSLWPLEAVARTPILDAFRSRDLIIPIEFFDDKNGAMPTPCIKFSFYYGRYKIDREPDTYKAGDAPGVGDCNDHSSNIHPGATEVAGNGLDDNCNGLADETVDSAGNIVPSTSTADADGDGVTIAQGDCDDTVATGKTTKPASAGGKEICGNGYDDDCSGVADDLPCDPFDGTGTTPSFVGPDSFVAGSNPPQPQILFDSGAIASVSQQFDAGKLMVNQLSAGPDFFQATLPAIKGVNLTLQLLGTRLTGDVSTDSSGNLTISRGLLGGVLSAQAMDAVTGINEPAIGLTPQNSLLDAVFAGGTLATLLALPTDANGHYLPDVNVDGGQLETFWSSTGGTTIDTCQDNHGKVYTSTASQRCVQLKDANGKFLFNDGLSVALTFSAVHGTIQSLPTGP